jgi:hypothetical protein
MKTMEIHEYDKDSNTGVIVTIPEISCRVIATPVDHMVVRLHHGENTIESRPCFDDYDDIIPNLNNDDDDWDDYIPRGMEDVLMDTEQLYNRIVVASNEVIVYDQYIEENFGSDYTKYKPIIVDIDYHKFHLFKYVDKFTYEFYDIIFETDDKRLFIPKNITGLKYPGCIDESIAVMHSPKMCKKPGNKQYNIWVSNNIFPVPALEQRPMDKKTLKKHKKHWEDIHRDFGHIRFKFLGEE